MNPRRIATIPMALLPAIALAALAAPGAPAAGGGPPVPGESFGAGVIGPANTPSGVFRYSTISQGRTTTIVATEADGGEIRRSRSIRGRWSVPAVTLEGEPGGLSADGETLILLHPDYSLRPDETRYLVLDAPRLRVRERLSLHGLVSFDAISPDGRLLYLVEYASPTDPFDYSVRAYDLARGEYRPGDVVDPSAPEEQMSGQPVARETSPDGRWAYTLYGGGDETFVHALDTEGATAVCVDLPQFEQGNPFRLGLDVDPSSGEITVLDRGEPAAAIDPESFEVSAITAPTAAAPDDEAGSPLLWAALGIIALAAGGLLARRRWRRAQGDAELERAFQAASQVGEPERQKEAEPVP